jgi:tRNA(Arg) A34 adenosine deaminase TadA
VVEEDNRHLRRAIELAIAARAHGNGPHGALLVASDGHTLAEAENSRITDRDITAHPELKLARWAARELDAETASGATLYTNCYPCVMCATVIERSGVGRVVYALASHETRELKAPSPSVPPAQVVYDGPALFEEARVAVEGYSERPRPEFHGMA